MQPTLYNNSLWGKDWTEALCDLPFQSASASSLKRCSFITEGMLSLPARRAHTFPWCLQRDPPSSSALLVLQESHSRCGERDGHGDWGLQVVFSSSRCLPSKPSNFLCSRVFAHPLAAVSGCAAEGNEMTCPRVQSTSASLGLPPAFLRSEDALLL